MPRLVSLKTKIKQLTGLLGTKDLSEWEHRFVDSVSEHLDDTTALSAKQAEKIEQIWERHFA